MTSKIPTPSMNHHPQPSYSRLQPNRTMKRQLSGENSMPTAKKYLLSNSGFSSQAGNNKFLDKMPCHSKPPSKPPMRNLQRSVSMASLGRSKNKIENTRTNQREKLTLSGRSSNVTALTVKNIGKINSGKSKRPAWDLKGRLLDMEKVLKENCDKISAYDLRMGSLEAEKNKLQENLVATKTHSENSQEEIGSLEKWLRNEKNERCQEKLKMETKIKELESLNTSLEGQVQKLQKEFITKSEEADRLKMAVSELESLKAGIESQYLSAKLLLESKVKKLEELESLVECQTASISEMTTKIIIGEVLRRKLHNEVQELKGNIQVYCRVRPLVGEEIAKNGGSTEIHHINVTDERTIELVKNENVDGNITGGLRNRNFYEFSFDRIFSVDVSQKIVYEEISHLIQSVLDGYNVCVFAYGQTGSGKTFTMEGIYNDDQLEGIIPRTIKHIFVAMKELKDKGWEYEAEASFLEIYNETIRDLLANPKEAQNFQYEIRLVDSKKPDIYVSNLKVLAVKQASQIHQLLEIAQQHRAVAATKMNDRSSRSHSVFQLKLKGTNSKTETACEGILNLVDLAGSERLKESGSEGVRLAETQSINKSLANLGNVIMALAQKQKHIPYRNSKLTHLLQNSLGGNSKTLMFVNISPLDLSFNETLNSLRFATKINQCQIGTAMKQVRK